MTRLLAIDPDFSEVRVGVLGRRGDSDVERHSLGAGEDPFRWFAKTYGEEPEAVVIAGGCYAPCPPGAYALDARMAEDAARIDAWHPRNRMTVRAYDHCSKAEIPCIVVDPMSSADIMPEARLSGYPGYERRGVYYAVPQRAAFMKAASDLGLDPRKAPIITVYLGDEASVAAHLGERVLDTGDPVACEGPFGFTSAGTAPATAFISYLSNESKGRQEVVDALKRRSGCFAYAGVSTLRELANLLAENHRGAVSALSAMAYQVSKEVGRNMAALKGAARAVAVAGPGTSVGPLISSIEVRVSKWCPVMVIEEDLAVSTLVREGLRALRAKSFLQYRGEKRS